MGSSRQKANHRTVLLSGGVGGARMARGLAAVLTPGKLTVVVNIGDDDLMYGVHVSPDLDTVVYTLAGAEGPHGWGLDGDSFIVMDRLAELGVDTTFRLGDRDLATCLERTNALGRGECLSAFTSGLTSALGVGSAVLPASDDPVRTKVQIAGGSWLDFQDYFVMRRHEDEVVSLAFEGASDARPAPDVIEAIADAATVIIAPSNPPLSIWPILAIDAIRAALQKKPAVIAVSPLFAGRAVKGPAASVLASLGLPPGNEGVAEAYEGLISHLVVDNVDSDDVAALTSDDVTVLATDTRIGDADGGARLAHRLLDIAGDRATPSPVR